jgi:NAD(P)-dependent dehydrogenase (short-subunit alcohol dehydrogenase family)|eukprot:Stramenopile-MAST_4_protein_3425
MICCVVTGASNGIGAAVVAALLEDAQTFVVGVDIVDIDYGVDHDRFVAFKVDVRRSADFRPVRRFLENKRLFVDALVCAAGVTASGPLTEMEEETFGRVLDVNVTGVFKTVRSFSPVLRPGSVVLPIVSEIAYAYNSAAFNGPYSMSKFALEAYTIALRQEVRLRGIDVIGVYPGSVNTQLALRDTVNIEREGPYGNALDRFRGVALDYIESNGVDPKHVGEAIAHACVHKLWKTSLFINVSMTMQISKYMPQSVLDFLTAMILDGFCDNRPCPDV